MCVLSYLIKTQGFRSTPPLPGLILNLRVLGRRLDMNLIGCSMQGLWRSMADIN